MNYFGELNREATQFLILARILSMTIGNCFILKIHREGTKTFWILFLKNGCQYYVMTAQWGRGEGVFTCPTGVCKTFLCIFEGGCENLYHHGIFQLVPHRNC